LAADLESLRNAGVAKELFQGTTDNPAAELILGGVFDALKHAPAVSATLNLEQNLQVRASLPFEGSWASKSRQFFYGQNLSGSGPEPLLPQNLVASLTTYRDVADWWLSKEDLFEESVIAQLAQADSQLSTIFSGMDFGEDVLGALQPRMQIVVTENTYAEKYQPDVKLPAFALVGKLKDPEKIQRKLKIAFQSVIGFANINLGMQGQPQLEMETETIDGAKISSAQYYYEADTPDGLMLFNFSPTVAFQDELVILASTRSLAVELAQLGQQSGQADGGGSRERTESKSNTHLKLDAKVLNEILEANLDSLVTQNMLTEGSTKEEAEQAIQTMLSIINLFEGMDFDYRIESDQMKFDLELKAKSLSQNRSGSSAETR
jgi:hypothetical protein